MHPRQRTPMERRDKEATIQAEEAQSNRRWAKANNARWTATLVIWGLGIVLLAALWRWQKGMPDPLGYWTALTIKVASFCSPFVLGPIRDWVDRSLDG